MTRIRIITSTKADTLSSAFVCFSAGLHKNYSTDFDKIHYKSVTWAKKEILDFGGNPHHVMLGLR